MIFFKEKYSPKYIENELVEKEKKYNGNIAAIKSEYISLETREKRVKIADAVISTLLTVVLTIAYKCFASGDNGPNESFLSIVACAFVISYVIVKKIQEKEYASLIKNKHILRCIMDKCEKDKKLEQDIELGRAEELRKSMSRLCALERSVVRITEKNYVCDKTFDIEVCLSTIMMLLKSEYRIKSDAWRNLVEDVLLFDPTVKDEEHKRLLLDRIDIQQKEMKELYDGFLKNIM